MHAYSLILPSQKNMYLENYLLICTGIFLQYCNFIRYYNYIMRKRSSDPQKEEEESAVVSSVQGDMMLQLCAQKLDCGRENTKAQRGAKTECVRSTGVPLCLSLVCSYSLLLGLVFVTVIWIISDLMYFLRSQM